MNTQPTFKEQFDKLTEAYIRNEVNPFKSCQCFVGNLLNKTTEWGACTRPIVVRDGGIHFAGLNLFSNRGIMLGKESIELQSGGLYTPEDIGMLERNFMKICQKGASGHPLSPHSWEQEWENPTPEMEQSLFEAFESTLDMLKAMHKSKGENVDGEFEFKKREQPQAVAI